MKNDFILKNLTIEITNRCPMNCLICSSESNHDSNVYLPLSTILRAIEESKELGLENLSISGGEPFEYYELGTLLELTYKRSICTSIYTCGNMTRNRKLTPLQSNLLKAVKDCNVELVFSIHGDRMTHDYTTGVNGSYNNLIASIAYANKLGITSKLHFVPTSVNYDKLVDIIDFSKFNQIKEIGLLRFVPQGRGEDNRRLLTLNLKQEEELSSNIQQLLANNAFPTRVGAHFNEFLINKNSKACTAGTQKAVLRSDGFLFPCSGMKKVKSFEKYIEKNINNNSIITAWNESYLFSKTRNILSQQRLLCSKCSMFTECFGGCLAQNVFYSEYYERFFHEEQQININITNKAQTTYFTRSSNFISGDTHGAR